MKIIITLFFLLFSLFPTTVLAVDNEFRATVQVVTDDAYRVEDDEGTMYIIERDIKISNTNDVSSGDKVIITKIGDEQNSSYIISNIWRAPFVAGIVILFFFCIILLNKKHGIKSLINLFVTFFIIIFFIIPFILKGYSPVFISTLGGLISMAWSLYFTHGINKKSHSALLSIFLSLLFAGIISWICMKLCSLTGFADDEATYLVNMGYEKMSIRGLLLASMIIGALGIMDDIVINQISVVEEIKNQNSHITKKELFASTLKIGNDHTSSMINTLVLAYVGAAFPLVILLHIGAPPFDTVTNILNNEVIATELIRTIVGTLTLLVAMPLSSFITIQWNNKKESAQ